MISRILKHYRKKRLAARIQDQITGYVNVGNYQAAYNLIDRLRRVRNI